MSLSSSTDAPGLAEVSASQFYRGVVPYDLPQSCDVLFRPSYVGYADADVVGTLDEPPHSLVHRVHLVASPRPGLVTVCESQEGWRFLPGGRLEPGEDMTEAAGRELMEEAGSSINGRLTPFFSQVASSRRNAPYMPHVPHPIIWWTFAAVNPTVVGAPTAPTGAEQITAIHHLAPQDAADWLDVHDPIHGGVVRLAVHLKLV
jgi:8-oxo-dGTP diphosphatase